MKIATVAERPDLVEPASAATRDTLPEYNNHGDVLNRYWDRLTEERPEFQFHIVDGDQILARARSIPVPGMDPSRIYRLGSTVPSRGGSMRASPTSSALL